MSSASPDFGRSPESNPPSTHSSPVGSDGEQKLLEAVLHETEKLLERLAWAQLAPSAGVADERAAIAELAERRRGEPFALDPIAKEMVAAALGPTFRRAMASDDAWNSMTLKIAKTLCDDPAAQDRLRGLWHRVSEGSA